MSARSMTDITSLDSGFDAPDGIAGHNHSPETGFRIRVTMPEDASFQMITNIRPLDLVWTLKRKVLDTITQSLKDPMNYGLYCPPSNMRVGKYLDEERPIKEYPLSVPIGLLEFKYKRKVYKTDFNPLKLKKMHTPTELKLRIFVYTELKLRIFVYTELKLFLDLVSQLKVDEINAKMNRGFDPNFNSVSKGETPLTLAATLTRPGAVILALVGGGAFIDFRNKKGLTPLHVATEAGNKDAVRILLDLGSSPNYKDADGLTPLCYATRKETPAVCIQWLLQERADIGRRDKKGWMEIHYACEHGLLQHLEQLLYYGADRNAQTTDSNDTPLHICARFNQGECARLLLIRGADKSLENKSKQDAAQVALASGHENVATIISSFRPDQVELFSDIPKYNEKRRGTISIATLRNLQRSRSNPNLLQQLFQQDSVLSATVSQATGVQFVSNGLIPNGVRSSGSHARPAATDLFGAGANGFAKTESSTQNHVERVIDLHRGSSGFGFVLRGPLDPPGSTLNFLPTSDIPARQYIDSVEPDSVAEKAGLLAGDFILEINNQPVIISSHKECVKLMRSGGDSLRLKVIRVQHPGTLRIEPKPTQNAGAVDTHHNDGTLKRNSLTSTDTAQAQSSLSGLEALENLDAALNNFDQTSTNSSEGPADHISETSPPVPMEFSSETASLDDVILITAPPPPAAFDNEVETAESDFPVPAPVLNEEVIAVLHAEDRVPDGHASKVSELEPRASVVNEKEMDNGEAASERVMPAQGKSAAVVAMSGIAAVELKEKVKADPSGRKGSHESPGKSIKVESVKEVTVVQSKNESDEKIHKAATGKKAVSLAYAVTNDDNRKSVAHQSNKTEVTTNRKSYAAPSPPHQQHSKTTSSPTIAATKVAVVAVAAASVRDEGDAQKVTSNDNHSDNPVAVTSPSKNVVPLAPPLPPPLPPPNFGTLSRSSTPQTSDGNKSPPSNGHRQLDESRKREESHAALMAAVLKRKNIVDATDGDQLADSIDARVNHTRTQQRIVYRADNTKEVKLPPVAAVGLLAPADGTLPLSPRKDEDSPGFRAEAEKMRQAFLLKKSVSREVSKQPEAAQEHSEEERKLVDDVRALPTNGALPKENTINRNANRPISTTMNPPTVLGDVAAIIAQKALARQRKDETESKVDEAKPKIIEAESKSTGTGLKVGDVSPQISGVAPTGLEKATVADRRSVFESETLKPPVSATLPKNSTSYSSKVSANANINGPNSLVVTRPQQQQQPTVANQQSKVYGASVPASATLQTNNKHPDSTLTSPNATLGNGKPSNRNSYVYTSSTLTTSTANVPRNRNTSVYPSSPPAAAEASATLIKSSRQMTTLPTGAKANAVKPSVTASPPVIPPPVEFASPTEAGFSTEVHTTATLRSKSSQSNSVVFRAKSSVSSESDVTEKTTFRNRSIITWSEDDVAEWLKSFDYSDYHKVFAEKKVTGQVLAQMKSNELEALGISNLLHRNRIEREIRSAVARK